MPQSSFRLWGGSARHQTILAMSWSTRTFTGGLSCPDWVPVMDTGQHFARIALKTMVDHGFDQRADRVAKVRNVSRLGSQFDPSLTTQGLGEAKVMKSFVFRFESSLGLRRYTGELCGQYGLTRAPGIECSSSPEGAGSSATRPSACFDIAIPVSFSLVSTTAFTFKLVLVRVAAPPRDLS
jgi:hypothetical protein